MDLDTDFRFSIPNHNNSALTNKEVVILVNKYVLARISSYFRNLFFGNWSERSTGANSFSIKEEADFNVFAFKLMVYSAMAMGWMVYNHKSNIFSDITTLELLKLSVKYDLSIMQNYCEKNLLHSKKCPKMEFLETVKQLELEKLKEHTLSTISPLDVSEDLERIVDIRARLSETTRRRLDKRMADKTEELRNELMKKRKIDGN